MVAIIYYNGRLFYLRRQSVRLREMLGRIYIFVFLLLLGWSVCK
jgi:hypothetical protein